MIPRWMLPVLCCALALGWQPARAADVLWLEARVQPFRVAPAQWPLEGGRAAAVPAERWTRVALEMIVKYQQNPLRASRVLALLHAAMNDAALLARREGASEAAALHRAAGLTLGYLYPQEADGKYEGMGIAAAAAASASPEAFARAARIGEAVAERAMGRAATDGAGRRWQVKDRPAPRPGQWRASPPLNAYDPAEPLAGEWRPWSLKRGDELRPPPPPVYDSPQWRAHLQEVLDVFRTLTPAQKKIAEEWNLGHGSVTPPGVWNRIALDLAREKRFTERRTVEMLAAANVAMMDAFIACWDAKFEWWTERPVTAIRERLDPSFMPLLVTPAFPSYVSGHSTVSGAAEVALAHFFPDRASWLKSQSEEAAQSRLYGGIHYRHDNDAGLDLGRRVGARTVARLAGSA